MKCCLKKALESFFPFLLFIFNYFLWYVVSFSQENPENVYKSCENVSFCYCTEINIALKKMYP